jgi:hypothetical protein
MTKMRAQLGVWSSAIGAMVAALSCTVMLAATLVGLLSVIGLRVSLAFADAFNQFLSPIAQPLLITSLALIVIGLVLRGRVPVALALIGGALVYLAMFILPSRSGTTAEMNSMSAMAGMSTTSSDPLSLAVFWLGIAVLAVAFMVAYRR